MRIPTFIFSFFILSLICAVAPAQTAPADSEPVIKGTTNYKLPQSAIDAGIDGNILVAIRINNTGKAEEVGVVAGPLWPCGSMPHSALREVSTTLSDTLMKLEFTPAIKRSKPIETTVVLTLKLKNPNILPAKVEFDQLTGKPKPVTINAGVVNGKAISLPKPEYPAEARMNRDGGAVSIQVVIDEKGKVSRAGAMSGVRTLQYAAREAACGAKFEPSLLQGNPITVMGIITYNFVP